MLRIISFLDETTGTELVLPVTPPGYSWSHGSAVETIALDQLGDLNVRGGRKLSQMSLDILLPAQLYPFCNPGTVANPWYYRDLLDKWSDSDTPVRFIVSGTPINIPVLIEDIVYQEKDGSNDLYAQISMREHQRPDVPALPVSSGESGTPRPAESAAAAASTHVVQKGETLWGIARKYYGDGSKYMRLATANNIKNPNLIYPKQVLTIPPATDMPAPVPASAAVQLAANTDYDSQSGSWRAKG